LKAGIIRLFYFLLFNLLIMYFVYVLYSLKDHKLYKGSTSDISKRFLRHNSGGNSSTAKRKPFVLVHIETFPDKSSALKRENYLKSPEGGFKLKEFLRKQDIFDMENLLSTE